MVGLVTDHHWIRPVSLALAVAMAAGCGAGESKPPTTQVVARVNDVEITVHQINAVLAQNPKLSPNDEAASKRQILNRLVDQQIAVQQALRRKLDRSPNVLQVLEAGRAEILARAFAEDFARAQPRPSLDEVQKYYVEHPELFSQRREFVLESISVAASEEIGLELKDRVARSGSMKAIAEWLRSRNVSFAENHGTRNAEEIPLQLLSKLHAMRIGEIQIFDEGGGRFQVIQVAATKPAPIDEATAAPRIQQFLFNRSLYEAIGREMKQLKAAARIEYLGEFANAAASKTEAKVEAQKRAEQTPKERAGATAETALDLQAKDPPKPSQLPQKSIEKGIRGLR